MFVVPAQSLSRGGGARGARLAERENAAETIKANVVEAAGIPKPPAGAAARARAAPMGTTGPRSILDGRRQAPEALAHWHQKN